MLSDTKARNAKPGHPPGKKPTGKPYKLGDRDGLYLYVSTGGVKSWRYDYRLQGARETLTIGRYPDIGLNAARRALIAARGLVATGRSPAKAKQEGKEKQRIARESTVRAFSEMWFAARADARSESWCQNARRWLDQDIYPAIGDKPFPAVTHDDIELLVRRIARERGAKSGYAAQNMLASIYRDLPRSFNLGNPARDLRGIIKLEKGKPRGMPMPAKDIPAFMLAVNRYPGAPATKMALRLLLLTLCRKSELTQAPWSEIDLDRGEWIVPAGRMKADRPHIIPLSRQAVECFAALKPLACGSPYVFPNLGNPNRTMGADTLNRAIARMGYAGKFTPHSTRSTASTLLNAQGWSADAIELQLAHAERNRVRAAYNHADRLEERGRMLQHWADFLDGLSVGKVVSGNFGRAA